MTTNNGRDFEDRAAAWAKRHYGGSVRIREHVSAPAAKLPYEVDIRVSIPTFLSAHDIWIECRDRKEHVKRAVVSDLVAKGGAVVKAYNRSKQDFYFDRLVIVSTSGFHDDALKVADDEGVECFEYDNREFKLRNSRKITFNEPWLRDAKSRGW